MALALGEYLSEAIGNREFYYSEHYPIDGESYYYIHLDGGGAIEVAAAGDGEVTFVEMDTVPSLWERDLNEIHPDTLNNWIVQLGAQHPDGA